MADWTDIADSVLEVGKPIRSIDHFALRDNITALAEGATGAPDILNAAIPAVTAGTVYYGNSMLLSKLLAAAGDTKLLTTRVAVNGTVRVQWSYWSNAGATVYTRCYKNGVAQGTEKSTTSTTPQVVTEDVTVSAGDVIAIYGRVGSTETLALYGINIGLAAQNFAPVGPTRIIDAGLSD